MWTQTKQNYDRHVEWIENWKDIVEEKDWASKARLVPLFSMDWQLPRPDVMGISKHILDKGVYIYFKHKDKVYVISK